MIELIGADDGPIIACSTGSIENTAISVIRLSGIADLSLIDDCFSFSVKDMEPRKAYFGSLMDSGRVVDQILCTFFKGPHSYNGEDILEISCHGNQINISRIIELFKSKGIRKANPGEFTFRALKNQKLSLSQVEGLDLLLNAKSGLMLDEGLEILQGDLHQNYLDLHRKFLRLKASLELSIDFLEDVGEEEAKKQLDQSFEEFFQHITDLNARTIQNSDSLLNPKIVLFGAPNAGKSTLFNKLLQRDRALTSMEKGTTRDYISENLKIEGNIFQLIDTAGIHEATNAVEKKGIEKTHEVLSKAFFSILLINSEEDFLEKDFENYPQIDFIFLSHWGGKDLKSMPASISNYAKENGIPLLVGDLVDGGSIGPLDQAGPIEPDEKNGPIGPVNSVAVRNALFYLISNNFKETMAKRPILIDRHTDLIQEISISAGQFQEELKGMSDIAIVSSELNLLGDKVEELIGVISPQEVLSSIFSNFCIGK